MMCDAARPLAIATLALVCVGSMPPAQAQDASPWDGEPHGATRLIAGASLKSAGTKLVRAGIEIGLDPGWKTYWRYPGDSGVPPTLDFAGSENIKSVTTLWPAPERFADGAGGYSIGYHGDVVLPLRIVPNDATKPSSLRLKLGYAVCGKLCVPAQADLDLTLSGKAGAEEPTLIAAEARVPRRAGAWRRPWLWHRLGSSPDRRQARARRRRGCRTGRRARRAVRRRPNSRLGAAASAGDQSRSRQHAGNAAIHV